MFSASPRRRGGASNAPLAASDDDLLGEDDPDKILAKHRIGNSKYTHFHVVIFVVTFFSYAMMHANRKSFSNVKVLISEEWTPSFSNATVPPKQPYSTWDAHQLFPSPDDQGCKTFLGTLDTVFMAAYAIGLFISGPLGDRLNLRYVLCGGMTLTSISIIMFANVPEWLHFYQIYWYVPIWILNGLFQSTAWPSVVAIMGNWFGKSHRGLIFGFWSANASVGNILGSLIAAAFVDLGYDYAMLVPAIILFCFAVALFVGLVVSPSEIETYDLLPRPSSSYLGAFTRDDVDEGYAETSQLLGNESDTEEGEDPSYSSNLELFFKGLPEPKDTEPVAGEEPRLTLPVTSSFGAIAPPIHPDAYERSETRNILSGSSNAGSSGYSTSTDKNGGVIVQQQQAVGFLEAVLLPGVIIYSVAYACLKLVNYSFFFWLPYYLSNQYHWAQSEADTLSIWYDVGGIFGGILGGMISDRLKRAPVMAVMLVIALPCLLIYKELPDDQLLNGFGLAVVGFFIGGVANIISAAVCADLGRQPKLRGNTSALATVTGILDGTGSAGAAIGQLLIPLLQGHLGWDSVFYMFVACTALTILCISPIVYREMKESRLGHSLRRCCCPNGDDRDHLIVREEVN